MPSKSYFTVRGWFGVANVKWLTRIEVRKDRFLGRLMGRDYVTIREEHHNGKTEVGARTGCAAERSLCSRRPGVATTDRRRRGEIPRRCMDQGKAGGEQV
jgi:hypothetical protein